MNIKQLAETFLRERQEGAPTDRSTNSSEWRSVGTASWLAGSKVEEARKGGFRVVMSARVAHMKSGACPADGRNLSASVGAVATRPDLGGEGRIPGAWRSGGHGQFVAAAVYGFKTRREAAEALASAVDQLGGSSTSMRTMMAQDSAKEDHIASFSKLAPIAEAQAEAAGWSTSRDDRSATLYAEPPDNNWERRLELKGNQWKWFQGFMADEPLPEWATKPIT